MEFCNFTGNENIKMNVTTFILIPQFSICYAFQNIRTFEYGFILNEKKYSYYNSMVSFFTIQHPLSTINLRVSTFVNL